MEQLWEFSSGGNNDLSAYTYANQEDAWSGIFKTDGKPKRWEKRPSIQEGIDKKRKVQRPMPDIGWLTPGTIILNENAYAVLKDFLLQFGELLEVNYNGGVRYFYNVINVIPCIDFEKSEKSSTGQSVLKAAFLPDAIPKDAQIFKDPRTVGGRIYLTQAAKDILEGIISENKLIGLWFFDAGKKF